MRFQITDAVKHLIIINVIMFIGTVSIGDGNLFYEWFSLYYPENSTFRPWQIVTHMFMHSMSDFTHIFFNMYALYLFGTALENYWGTKKFVIYYLTCGVGAFFLHMGVRSLHGRLSPAPAPSQVLFDVG